jgi:D-alanine-D-alanine ligase
MSKKLTIAVLAGGNTAEKGISKLTGAAVTAACHELGHRVLQFDPAKDLARLIAAKKQIDLVFPALHGRGGEDGSIQGLLSLLGLPFVGPDIFGGAASFDKSLAKEFYRAAGLPVARDFLAYKSDPEAAQSAFKKVGLPCFVKPASEGSSYGAGPVHKKAQLLPALQNAWKYEAKALVEELLTGTEITVGVLETETGLRALPVIEIRSKNAFFDLESKYDPTLAEELVPAPISAKLTAQAKSLAKKAHQALKLRHLSRTDMIIRRGKLYLLETNTLPGFTTNSLFPKMAKAAGMSFPELIAHLIRLALR